MDATADAATQPTGDSASNCWIDLRGGAHDDIEQVASNFGLHRLAVEDALHAHQRPKLERYDDTLVVVAKPAVYDDHDEAIRIGELLVAVGPTFVMSVRHGVAEEIDANGHDNARHPLGDRRPIQVLYDLLDEVVDAYQPILEGLQVDIQEIEHDVFSLDRTNPAGRIYALKRHVLDMLRNVEPLVHPLEELSRGEGVPGHDERLEEYFRDVADHAERLVEQLHTVNDVLSDALQANLAQVSVAQNDDMRRMSAWAAIFLVPTLLAGLWGMNFESMPELDWAYGYPVALGAMVVTSVGLWWQLRRSGWLEAPRRERQRRRGATGSADVTTSRG
jgi:magnesium transporter